MRLLLFCDYHTGLLDGLAETMDRVTREERVLVRKRSGSEWKHPRTRVIDLPLGVFHEERPFTAQSFLSLVAYLVLATIRGVREVLRHRLEAIMAVFGFPQGVAALLVALLTRRKLLIMTDGGDIDILFRISVIRPIMVFCLRRANLVTSLNRSKARLLDSFGISTELCPTIGVDTLRFRYMSFREKLKNSVLYVGRLSIEKRPLLLVSALNRVRRNGQSFRLNIVGDGPLMENLRGTVRQLDMQGVVRLWEYVPHSRVQRLFAECSIFVLPSVREGVSVSLIEAMASGCICVVSDIPDNAEIIKNGWNGFVFPADDEVSLASVLTSVLALDSKTLTLISTRARILVEEKYSLESVANSLRNVISCHAKGCPP